MTAAGKRFLPGTVKMVWILCALFTRYPSFQACNSGMQQVLDGGWGGWSVGGWMGGWVEVGRREGGKDVPLPEGA